MHRAKEFLHHTAEHILKFMEDHDDKMTTDKVVYVAELCEHHNNICEFIEYVQKHKEGSLFGGEHWNKEHKMSHDKRFQ